MLKTFRVKLRKSYLLHVLWSVRMLFEQTHLYLFILTIYIYTYCVKKNQLDAQLILSAFRQPPHVSGVSRPIIRRYNCMYTTIQSNQDNINLKRTISTNCIHTVVPPEDGPRHARNMSRLTKYTKNKLCVKFFYAMISRCTVNKT